MVIGVFILLILCSVYFVRLLAKKRMFLAAVTIAVSTIVLILWGAFVVTLGSSNAGIAPTSIQFYTRSLTDIFDDVLDIMPWVMRPVANTVITVSVVIVTVSIIAIVHGSIKVGKEIAAKVGSMRPASQCVPAVTKLTDWTGYFGTALLLKLHCRLNC